MSEIKKFIIDKILTPIGLCIFYAQTFSPIVLNNIKYTIKHIIYAIKYNKITRRSITIIITVCILTISFLSIVLHGSHNYKINSYKSNYITYDEEISDDVQYSAETVVFNEIRDQNIFSYVKLTANNNIICVDITSNNIDSMYKNNSEQVEHDVIELSNNILYILDSYDVKFNLMFNMISNKDHDVVLFMVENNEVTWSIYDSPRKSYN